jgi:precorrin isomerase
MEYIKNGEEIYRKSFAIIRAETNWKNLPDDLAHVAVRLIHSCGMTDITEDLEASPDAVKIGRNALAGVQQFSVILKWSLMALPKPVYLKIIRLFVPSIIQK